MTKANISGYLLPDSHGRYRRIFLFPAGMVLAATGLAKLFALFGDTTIPLVIDLVFGVRFSFLILGVGLAELAIAMICIFSSWNTVSIVLVASISSVFLLIDW